MIDVADPERMLVLSYAPAEARPALAALWALDERLGGVVAGTREPSLGLIRLAWWREALERLDAGAAPAEPLLIALQEHALPAGATGHGLGAVADGWTSLLGPVIDDAALEQFADGRGGVLFTEAGHVLGVPAPPDLAGAGGMWALVDLARRGSAEASADALALAGIRSAAIRPSAWPRRLRPLAALALLAQRDVRRGGGGRSGAPLRVARLALAGLLGR